MNEQRLAADLMGETTASPAPDAGAALLRAVSSINASLMIEPSFRLSGARILANRFFLAGIPTVASPTDLNAKVLDICRELSMPPAFFDTAAYHFSRAAFVHFGVEATQDASIYKLYFEFRNQVDLDRDVAGRGGAPHPPELLFLAYKWGRPSSVKPVVTRYIWFPRIDFQEIQRRIGRILQADSARIAWGATERFLREAAVQSSPVTWRFMEVREDDNARLSFDLNFYDVRLQLWQVQESLSGMGLACHVPAELFERHFRRIEHEQLGHVAGGVHRDRRPFFSIYYGARPWTPGEVSHWPIQNVEVSDG